MLPMTREWVAKAESDYDGACEALQSRKKSRLDRICFFSQHDPVRGPAAVSGNMGDAARGAERHPHVSPLPFDCTASARAAALGFAEAPPALAGLEVGEEPLPLNPSEYKTVQALADAVPSLFRLIP